MNPVSEKTFYLQWQTQRAIFHLREEDRRSFSIHRAFKGNRYALFWQGKAFKRGQNDYWIWDSWKEKISENPARIWVSRVPKITSLKQRIRLSIRVCREYVKSKGRKEPYLSQGESTGRVVERRGEQGGASQIIPPRPSLLGLRYDHSSPAKEYSLEYSLAVDFELGGKGRKDQLQERVLSFMEPVSISKEKKLC